MLEKLRPPVQLKLPIREIWGDSDAIKELLATKLEQAFSKTKKLERDRAYSSDFNFYRMVISAVSKEDAANYLYNRVRSGAVNLEDIDVILGLVAPLEK